MTTLVRFLNDQNGVTAVEYSLIAAATGLALIATVPTINANLKAIFEAIVFPT